MQQGRRVLRAADTRAEQVPDTATSAVRMPPDSTEAEHIAEPGTEAASADTAEPACTEAAAGTADIEAAPVQADTVEREPDTAAGPDGIEAAVRESGQAPDTEASAEEPAVQAAVPAGTEAEAQAVPADTRAEQVCTEAADTASAPYSASSSAAVDSSSSPELSLPWELCIRSRHTEAERNSSAEDKPERESAEAEQAPADTEAVKEPEQGP